jgi:hypothetical protein
MRSIATVNNNYVTLASSLVFFSLLVW